MSFRLFVYYCAVCGGWAAFLGWILGLALSPKTDMQAPSSSFQTTNTGQDTPPPSHSRSNELASGIKFGSVGLMVALGLSLVDATWVFGMRRVGPILLRVGMALAVGALGGFICGFLGQLLAETLSWIFSAILVFSWTIVGALIGASIGLFEVLASLVKNQNVNSSSRKLIKCGIGGTVGGLLGSVLQLLFRAVLASFFPTKAVDWLWFPAATGCVALGACIGLLVGLAQVILKDAWVKVEAGFRAGREMILAKEATSIGRGEACDIGLFGDAGIEKLHACIMMKGNAYFLEDVNTPGGTYVNDVKVSGSRPLRNGDMIRVGRSLLRFYERPKK